jgi:hypothetical protein
MVYHFAQYCSLAVMFEMFQKKIQFGTKITKKNTPKKKKKKKVKYIFFNWCIQRNPNGSKKLHYGLLLDKSDKLSDRSQIPLINHFDQNTKLFFQPSISHFPGIIFVLLIFVFNYYCIFTDKTNEYSILHHTHSFFFSQQFFFPLNKRFEIFFSFPFFL